MNNISKKEQLEMAKETIEKVILNNSELSSMIDPDEELVDSKILSSLALVELVFSLEELIGKQIINDDVGFEQFSTVNKILTHLASIIEE